MLKFIVEVPNMYTRVFDMETFDQNSTRTNQRVLEEDPTSGQQTANNNIFCSLVIGLHRGLSPPYVEQFVHVVDTTETQLPRKLFSNKSCGNSFALRTSSTMKISKLVVEFDMFENPKKIGVFW